MRYRQNMADTMEASQIKTEVKDDFVNVWPNPAAEVSSPPTLYGFPGRTKSPVWKEFGFYMGADGKLDKSRAICRHCLTGVRYCGNTTNLHTHLVRHGHGSRRPPRPLIPDVGQGSPPSPAINKASPLSPFANGATIVTNVQEIALQPSIVSSVQKVALQPSIVSSVVQNVAFQPNIVTSAQTGLQPTISDVHVVTNTQRSISLNTMIAEYFIDRMETPEGFDNTAFVNMMSAADPGFDPETSRQFYESFISQHYEILNHSLSDLLKNCESVAMTCDKWTSESRENYVTYSVHLVSETWGLDSYTLTTNPDSGSIVEDLNKVRTQWDIQESVTVVSGDDMGQSSLGIQTIHCLAEAINKAARAGLNLECVRELLSNISHTQQELVKNFSEVNHDISTSSPTNTLACQNWLFTYDILAKLMDQKELIKLMDGVDSIDCTSLCKQLEDVCTVLNPLKSAVDLMCSQTPITASMILPIIKKLQVSLSSENCDSVTVKIMKETVWNTLYSFYSDSSVRKFLLISSFLDPRFKDLLFVESEERARARGILLGLATDLYRRGADTPIQEEAVVRSEVDGTSYSVILVDNDKNSEPKTKKLKREEVKVSNTSSKSDDWLADVIGSRKAPDDITKEEESVLAEIDQYCTMEQRTTSPCKWWNNRQLVFTTLSRVAKIYLCVPATSKPPDRMFEKVRHRYTTQRRLLPSAFVDKLIFLHDNYIKLKN